MDFNRRLYSPGGATSTRPRPVTTTTTPLGNGWDNIGGGRTQYGTNLTPYGDVSVSQRVTTRPSGNADIPPSYGGFPMGPDAPDPTQPSYLIGAGGTPSDGSGEIGSAASANIGASAIPSNGQIHPDVGVGNTPAQNAMQAHQAEAATPPDMRPISSARRFFWATGLIDGRAPLAAASAPTDFDATFGGGATHLGGPGVTWDQRQQQNQQHISDATKQRGLDWSPY